MHKPVGAVHFYVTKELSGKCLAFSRQTVTLHLPCPATNSLGVYDYFGMVFQDTDKVRFLTQHVYISVPLTLSSSRTPTKTVLHEPMGTLMQSGLNLLKLLYLTCMVNLYQCAEGIDNNSNQLSPFNFGGSNQWQKREKLLTFKSVLALELSPVLSDLSHFS